MAISAFEVNTGVTRVQDFSVMKQNEDNKNMVDQQQIHVKVEKESTEKFQKVQKNENAEKKNDSYDARDKGSGIYMGDGGKRRKKSQSKEDGKVVIKGHNNIDIKI